MAQEVGELFGRELRAEGRIVVVPFGVPPLGTDTRLPAGVADRIGGGRAVVAIGALGPRKNLPRLVRAFGGIAAERPDVVLILAGPDGPDRPAIDASIAGLPPAVRGRIVLPGAVGAAERRGLLGAATMLAYPSIYEGFGFPMLEAMRAGVPVLAGRVAALQEVAREAARFADPWDEADLAAGLVALLDDEAARRALIAKGAARVEAFSWDRTAEGLSTAYRGLATISS